MWSFGRWINTAGLIRDDLTAAGIEPTDRDGNVICFHSLRNSYISYLANSETPAKVVMQLARHSDPRLTFNTYARTFEEAEQKAISCLPNFGDFVLSTSLDNNRIKQEIFIDNHRHKNSQDTLINAVLAANQNTPKGNRTPVAGLRTRRPRPLDDGGGYYFRLQILDFGFKYSEKL